MLGFWYWWNLLIHQNEWLCCDGLMQLRREESMLVSGLFRRRSNCASTHVRALINVQLCMVGTGSGTTESA